LQGPSWRRTGKRILLLSVHFSFKRRHSRGSPIRTPDALIIFIVICPLRYAGAGAQVDSQPRGATHGPTGRQTRAQGARARTPADFLTHVFLRGLRDRVAHIICARDPASEPSELFYGETTCVYARALGLHIHRGRACRRRSAAPFDRKLLLLTGSAGH
jgi:hypothetical protein